jgi:hypothetical protein
LLINNSSALGAHACRSFFSGRGVASLVRKRTLAQLIVGWVALALVSASVSQGAENSQEPSPDDFPFPLQLWTDIDHNGEPPRLIFAMRDQPGKWMARSANYLMMLRRLSSERANLQVVLDYLKADCREVSDVVQFKSIGGDEGSTWVRCGNRELRLHYFQTEMLSGKLQWPPFTIAPFDSHLLATEPPVGSFPYTPEPGTIYSGDGRREEATGLRIDEYRWKAVGKGHSMVLNRKPEDLLALQAILVGGYDADCQKVTEIVRVDDEWSWANCSNHHFKLRDKGSKSDPYVVTLDEHPN